MTSASTMMSLESCQGAEDLAGMLPTSSTPTPPRVATVQSSEGILAEFPSVFDGKVKVMEGEKFHITLAGDAQLFCVHTPRTIPFARNFRPSWTCCNPRESLPRSPCLRNGVRLSWLRPRKTLRKSGFASTSPGSTNSCGGSDTNLPLQHMPSPTLPRRMLRYSLSLRR